MLFWVLACTAAAALAANSVDARVVERSNAFRSEQGLPKQAKEPKLAEAAQAFAHFMADSGKYGHAADGRQPAQRAAAQGYDWCVVLENIAWTYRSSGYDAPALAATLVEGWKNSPEHRKNLLDPAATETGVGVAQAKNGRYYAVQMFARPKSAAISFKLQNPSGKSASYRLDGTRYALPARSVRTHTVCRDMPLRIGNSSVKPENGATYSVSAD